MNYYSLEDSPLNVPHTPKPAARVVKHSPTWIDLD